MHNFVVAALTLLFFPFPVSAIVLNLSDHQSILDAASTAAYGVQYLYYGNSSFGELGKWPSPPYYWWESGGAWGGMMHYWASSHDDSYNDVMMDALVSQLGPDYDFNLAQEASQEGNDDQAFWVFNSMSAAEYGFPEPPSPAPSWLTVTENAWNDFVSRWNTTYCNGGLKWQFHQSNAGYYYKNSVSNGAFFQLSARLARFTGNTTYANWANKIWDWSRGIGLVDDNYNVFDGAAELLNCSQLDHHQWTYNLGSYLYGAAVMSNYTNASDTWVDRTNGLLEASATFFTPFPDAVNIMFEAACEIKSTCNVDQWSMKAYLSRWLATSSLVAPYTTARIGILVRASALGAASACTGGQYGNSCGSKWYTGSYDGNTGLGQELSAMEIFTALLVNDTNPLITSPNVTIPIYVPRPGDNVTATDANSTSRPLVDGPAGFGVKEGVSTLGLFLAMGVALVAWHSV